MEPQTRKGETRCECLTKKDVPEGMYSDKIMSGEITTTIKSEGQPTVVKTFVDRRVEGKLERQKDERWCNISWTVGIKVEQLTNRGIRTLHLFQKNCKGRTGLTAARKSISLMIEYLVEMQDAFDQCIGEAETFAAIAEKEK